MATEGIHLPISCWRLSAFTCWSFGSDWVNWLADHLVAIECFHLLIDWWRLSAFTCLSAGVDWVHSLSEQLVATEWIHLLIGWWRLSAITCWSDGGDWVHSLALIITAVLVLETRYSGLAVVTRFCVHGDEPLKFPNKPVKILSDWTADQVPSERFYWFVFSCLLLSHCKFIRNAPVSCL